MGGLQHAVAGKADDGAVNLLVDLEIFPQLAAIVVPFDAVLQRLEPLEIGRHHSFRSKFRRAAFDSAHRFEQFNKFVAAERCDDGAPVKTKFDQTFRCQLFQSLAQRGSRDPESVGQIKFEQLLFWRKITADDQQTKSYRSLLMETGSRHTQPPSLKRRHAARPLGFGFGLRLGHGRYFVRLMNKCAFERSDYGQRSDSRGP